MTTPTPATTTHPWFRAELHTRYYRCPSRFVYVRKVEGYLYEPEKTVEVFDGGYPFRITPEEARAHYRLLKGTTVNQADVTRRRDWEITR